jgi:enterochelin esterase-like enzyme
MRSLALLALAAAAAGCGGSAHPPVRRSPPTVRYASFHSAALAGVEHYAVYLPAGYASGRRRYPVIYALHGLPSDAGGYRRMGIASWGADAVRAGRPAIVVAPQGARPGDTDPEWHDWGPGRDWENAVAEELVEQVDRRFRTIADRRGRALIGASAGGYGATIIGVRHPGTFSVIESWSGYFHPTDPTGTKALDLGAKNDVHKQLVATRDRLRRLPTMIGFYVGDGDSRFLAENKQLNVELSRAGVSHIFRIYSGGHEQRLWQRYATSWLTLALAHLAPAQ